MNRIVVKYLGGIATVLMVLSLFSTGALAYARDSGMNEDNGHMMGGPAMIECVGNEDNDFRAAGMPGNGMKMGYSDSFGPEKAGNGLLVVSEDFFEDMSFEEAQDMMLDHVDNRIEHLNLAGELLDNDERCPLTEEEIADGLAELESIREEITAAEDLEDLDSVRFTLAQEYLERCLDQKIERLNSAQARLDYDKACPLTEEEIADGLAELESLKEEIATAEDLDDLESVSFALASEGLDHSLDQKVQRLNLMQLRLDNGYSCPLTEEEIANGLATLEALQDDVSAAEDVEDLESVRFTLASQSLEHFLDQKIELLNFAQLCIDNGYSYPMSEDEIADSLSTLEGLQDDVAAAEDREDLDVIRDELKEVAGEFREEHGIEKPERHPGNFDGNEEMDE